MEEFFKAMGLWTKDKSGPQPNYHDYLQPNAFNIAAADKLPPIYGVFQLPKKSQEARELGGWITNYQNTYGFTIEDTLNYKTRSPSHENDPDVQVSKNVVTNNSKILNDYIAQFESDADDPYTALNKGSGAYGKYQHLPSMTRKASKRLGKTTEYLRTPEGQEEAQNWLLKENTAELGRRGMKVTPMNAYGIHQQGGYLYSKMMSGKELSPKDQKLIAGNTPERFRGSTGNLVDDWKSAYGRNKSEW